MLLSRVHGHPVYRSLEELLADPEVEIVVNLEADRVEHRLGQRIMSRAHAFWSIGFFGAGLLGAGVAQLPEWIVHDDLTKKRLIPVLPELKLSVVEVFGMFHRGARGSAAIRVVLDFLADELPRRMMDTR